MADLKDAAREVVTRLRAEGHEAYWVGGCVRDMLMGRAPADYDVATSAIPENVLELFPKAIGVGAQFGVVKVLLGGYEVEVATFRSDHGILDGRHPAQVRFSRTVREDVERRDFTINAMMYDPDTEAVLDFAGGQKDIADGVVRTVGDPAERFVEDRLRMMRAVRFAARFDFRIDTATFDAIREHRAGVKDISVERIRDELLKMLTEGRARRAFELLDETGLLEEVLPEVAAFKGVEQPAEFHPEGDVWSHVLLMLEQMESPTETLALGVLLHDVGKPATFERAPDRIRFNGHPQVGAAMAEEICNRLRLSTAMKDRVVALVRDHLKFIDVPRMRQSTLKRFLRQDGFDEHLELHRLDCLSSHRNLDHYHFAREALASLPEEKLRPPRLLTGHELIAAGYPQGPRIGEILTAVEEKQLDGDLNTPDEARAFVRAEFPLAGG